MHKLKYIFYRISEFWSCIATPAAHTHLFKLDNMKKWDAVRPGAPSRFRFTVSPLTTYKENPQKIPVWEKLRKSFSFSYSLISTSAGGTVKSKCIVHQVRINISLQTLLFVFCSIRLQYYCRDQKSSIPRYRQTGIQTESISFLLC
jgi:hypothetical protein